MHTSEEVTVAKETTWICMNACEEYSEEVLRHQR